MVYNNLSPLYDWVIRVWNRCFILGNVQIQYMGFHISSKKWNSSWTDIISIIGWFEKYKNKLYLALESNKPPEENCRTY